MERINSMHPSLAIVADQLIGTFLTASRALIPILLIIVLVYSLVRSLVQGQHITMDFKLLVRGLMLFFVVSVYPEVMGMLSMAIGAITDMINVPDEELALTFQTLAEKAAATQGEPEGMIDSVSKWFSDVWDGVSSIWLWMGTMVQEGLLYVIRAGISLVRSIILAFLYLVGPIAIAIAIIPGFENTALSWLKAFIGVQCWQLTINILDLLMKAYTEHGFAVLEHGVADDYTMLVNTCFVLMYLLVPALTNYFINTGGASNILGQMFTAGAAGFMATRLATKVATGGVRKGAGAIRVAFNRKDSPHSS